MPDMPFFSIITVTLNNLVGIHKTFDSLKQQSLTNYEWIVIDGASRDGTFKFLENLRMQALHWISEPDQGIYDAMNKGMSKASGKYLLFLNGGDELSSPEILLEIKNFAIAKLFPDLIYGDAIDVVSDREFFYKKAYSHKKIWYGMFTHHQAILYKRQMLENITYDLNYLVASDYDLTCRFIKRVKNVQYIPVSICNFRKGGLSSQQVRRGILEQWKIKREVLGISTTKRIMLLLLHGLIHVVRLVTPGVYRKVRYS